MKRRSIAVFLNVFFVAVLYGQSYRDIRGTVCDRASGAPLAYATVSVVGTQPLLGAVADSMGRFVVPHVPVGRWDVLVGFVGYEPVIVKDVILSSAREAYLEVRMSESASALGEVVVKPSVDKSRPLNAMALGSARMLSVEEAGRYAGGFDDPARLASAFAGTAGGIGNNGIVVRGNSPKFLQWRLEGVEIPNPNHFADVTIFGGGAMTAFSAHLLGNSDFLTGTFPAEYGNALSGVFDMNLRHGNSSRHEHTFRLGVIGIDFASEGPLRRGGNASYIFNYRYSTLALMAPALPENAGAIRYQDLSFKLNFPTRRAGVFSLWGIGWTDRSGQEAGGDSLLWEYARDRQEMRQKLRSAAFGANHSVEIGGVGRLKTSLAATTAALDFLTESLDDALRLRPYSRIENMQQSIVFSAFLHRKFGARHVNRTGIRITGLRYDLLLENAPGSQLVADESGFAMLTSASSSSSFTLSEAWTLNLGIHAQRFGLNGRYAVEPRAGVRRKFGHGRALGLSYGLHSRMEMLGYYFTRSATGERMNRNLDFTRAHHFVVTYDRDLSGDRHLRIEPYIQLLYSVPVTAGGSFSFINLQREPFAPYRLENTGRGRNFGVDVTFEQYMSRGYYYTCTASLFDSRYRAGDGVWRHSRYDRNFVFNLLAGKEWMLGRGGQNVFSAGIRLTYQGGERHSPVDEAASQRAEDVVYDENAAFAEQYPPSLVGHFTVGYKINGKGSAHEFSLNMINATMSREYYGHLYNLKTRRIDVDQETMMIPNVSYRIEF
ncbi:MAG: carboxypeptidase-like regulatory domain-containing protein [Tannerella sp.]|nr:carboxypeptidase-like regulatory domain-containing protein [Tannerella sp.]